MHPVGDLNLKGGVPKGRSGTIPTFVVQGVRTRIKILALVKNNSYCNL